MAGLEWQLKPIEGEDSATLAEMSGAIDGNTVPSFQQMLEEIKSKGVQRLVLDMSKIKYVNSTGLGSLVKYADTFKSSGGGMALIKVPAKVKIVIEMLGLNAFFAICGDLPQALQSLEHTTSAREPAAAAPPSSKPGPAASRPPSSGPVPQVRAPAPAPPPAPPPPAPARQGKKASFPVVSACQKCGVQIEFRDAGNWKCPRCYAVASVENDGSARFGRSDRPSPITLSLTATPECRDGLLHLVTAVCGTAFNGNNLDAVRNSIFEVASVMQTAIYPGNPEGVYHVAIDRQPGRVQIRVADAGKTLEQGWAAQYFPNASRQMNEFDCRPHPTGGGNVIRMVKTG